MNAIKYFNSLFEGANEDDELIIKTLSNPTEKLELILVSHPKEDKAFAVPEDEFKEFCSMLDAGDFSFNQENKPSINEINIGEENWLLLGYRKVELEEVEEFSKKLEEFEENFSTLIGRALKLTEGLKKSIVKQDHDLYISFKARDDFKGIRIGLDKVYPQLPADGVYELGEEDIDLSIWENECANTLTNVKSIIGVEVLINKLISNFYSKVSGEHPGFHSLFELRLKQQLMAASHFMEKIYSFVGIHNEELVNEVVSKILESLSTVKDNIGLDLNSWLVWDYSDSSKPPVRRTEPELDVKKYLHDNFTDSFIDAVYGVLLNMVNPKIKPYFYRTKVEEGDDSPIGTITPVTNK